MTVISALMSLIIALLFHVSAMVSVITALMTILVALMSVIIRMMSVMTAVMTGITGVMSVIIRIMWLVIGMTWLMKKVMSILIAMMTVSDRRSKTVRAGRAGFSRTSSRRADKITSLVLPHPEDRDRRERGPRVGCHPGG